MHIANPKNLHHMCAFISFQLFMAAAIYCYSYELGVVVVFHEAERSTIS